MKRTPISIVNDLIMALNTLLPENEYSINTLAEFADLHWETTSRYLEIIKKISDCSPLFVYTTNRKIKLISQNKNLIIDNDDRILLYSLQNEAFNDKSAVNIPDSLKVDMEFLVEKNFGQKTEVGNFFLNERGKNMAIETYIEIKTKIEKGDLLSEDLNAAIDLMESRQPCINLNDLDSLLPILINIIDEKFRLSYTHGHTIRSDKIASTYCF